jgi:hypothetical protein
MSAAEQYVQVAADSTGKKIRNLELSVLQPDGTIATVEMQVVAIASPDGALLHLDQAALLTEILLELRRVRMGLQLLVGDELSV